MLTCSFQNAVTVQESTLKSTELKRSNGIQKTMNVIITIMYTQKRVEENMKNNFSILTAFNVLVRYFLLGHGLLN